MGVVLLRHAGVGMAELGGDDPHRHPVHREMRAVGVTQDVESDRGGDPGPPARLLQRAFLMRGAPRRAVGTEEDQIGRGAIRSPSLERGLAFVRQDDMPHLALAEPDGHPLSFGLQY